MAMVDVDDSCQYSADSQPKSNGFVWGWTLAMTLGHDDSTINIAMAIIIIIIIKAAPNAGTIRYEMLF